VQSEKVVFLAASAVLHQPFLKYRFKPKTGQASAAAVKSPTPSSLPVLHIYLVNSAAASAVNCCVLMMQCHQHVCACRAQLTLLCQLDAVPSAFSRLVVSNKQFKFHCKRLQHELAQSKDALSKSQASLDTRNEQMLQLHKKTSAARTE
jgi:hypothetical protein